jgi:hypothetical protein
MWQSKIWNGQDAAFRMFVVLTLTLIYLSLPEPSLETDAQAIIGNNGDNTRGF